MVKCLTVFILLAIVTTAHVNFVIRVPAVAPLYMKVDSNSKITTFSGGTLSVLDGVTILAYP